MSNLKNNDPSLFILSTHRIIFPHLDVPHLYKSEDGKEDKAPKFSCTWLIQKQHPDAAAIMGAMYAIYQSEALSKFKGMPWEMIGQKDGIDCPLRDGDEYANRKIMLGGTEEMYGPYRGHYFIKATSSAEWPPVVFQQLPGQGRVEVVNIKQEMYGGCYARGVIKCQAWQNSGKYGFSFYINSVLKTAEGPKLGGGGGANAADYDMGADATDASQLLPGEAPAPVGLPGLPGVAAPGRVMTPGLPPTLPQAAALPGVVPAAQRAALPSMTPPTVPGAAPMLPQMAPPPVMAPPAIAPQYAVDEGSQRQIVSFDGGVNWEWVQ